MSEELKIPDDLKHDYEFIRAQNICYLSFRENKILRLIVRIGRLYKAWDDDRRALKDANAAMEEKDAEIERLRTELFTAQSDALKEFERCITEIVASKTLAIRDDYDYNKGFNAGMDQAIKFIRRYMRGQGLFQDHTAPSTPDGITE